MEQDVFFVLSYSIEGGIFEKVYTFQTAVS
jgi:hypothetical protein